MGKSGNYEFQESDRELTNYFGENSAENGDYHETGREYENFAKIEKTKRSAPFQYTEHSEP